MPNGFSLIGKGIRYYKKHGAKKTVKKVLFKLTSSERFKEANYEIILKFDCRSDGILDILKNGYYVESGTLIIEMK